MASTNSAEATDNRTTKQTRPGFLLRKPGRVYTLKYILRYVLSLILFADPYKPEGIPSFFGRKHATFEDGVFQGSEVHGFGEVGVHAGVEAALDVLGGYRQGLILLGGSACALCSSSCSAWISVRHSNKRGLNAPHSPFRIIRMAVS